MALYVRRRPELEQFAGLLVEPQPLGADIDPASCDLWEEFARGRPFDGVYALWRDTTIQNAGIRQRAVSALTAPGDADLPYAHPGQGVDQLLQVREEVHGEHTTSLRKRLADCPQLAQECAAGILYWLKHGRCERIEAVQQHARQYMQAAQELLPIIDASTADELFVECIADTPLTPEGTAQGQQLTQLILDEEVPAQYRHAAFDMWLTLLDQDIKLSGVAGLQVERLTRPLAAMVELAAHTKKLDDSMFCGAITYLEARIVPNQVYVHGHNVSTVAWTIVDSDVRYAFAWRHLQAQPNPYSSFRIRTEADMALMHWVQVVTWQRKSGAFNQRARHLMDEYRQWIRNYTYRAGVEADLIQRLRRS